MGEIRVFHENIVKLLNCTEMQRDEQSVTIEYFDQMKFWERDLTQSTDTIPRMEPKEETQVQVLLKYWSKSGSSTKAVVMEAVHYCMKLWDESFDLIDEFDIPMICFHGFTNQIYDEDLSHQQE